MYLLTLVKFIFFAKLYIFENVAYVNSLPDLVGHSGRSGPPQAAQAHVLGVATRCCCTEPSSQLSVTSRDPYLVAWQHSQRESWTPVSGNNIGIVLIQAANVICRSD